VFSGVLLSSLFTLETSVLVLLNNINDNHLQPFIHDYLGELVPEETFTHSHLS